MTSISSNNDGHSVSIKNLEMTQKVSDLTIFQMSLMYMLGVTVINHTHDYHITTPL
jgi:hypothetical protein